MGAAEAKAETDRGYLHLIKIFSWHKNFMKKSLFLPVKDNNMKEWLRNIKLKALGLHLFLHE